MSIRSNNVPGRVHRGHRACDSSSQTGEIESCASSFTGALGPTYRREPICFNPLLYRARNLVERFFNKIKQFRRVATRYDK
jgi:transposase